jgi:hypothetical protein
MGTYRLGCSRRIDVGRYWTLGPYSAAAAGARTRLRNSPKGDPHELPRAFLPSFETTIPPVSKTPAPARTMKFIALALAAVALVAAQSTPDISNLPTCVLGCYATDTGSSCSQTDL